MAHERFVQSLNLEVETKSWREKGLFRSDKTQCLHLTLPNTHTCSHNISLIMQRVISHFNHIMCSNLNFRGTKGNSCQRVCPSNMVLPIYCLSFMVLYKALQTASIREDFSAAEMRKCARPKIMDTFLFLKVRLLCVMTLSWFTVELRGTEHQVLVKSIPAVMGETVCCLN